MKKFSLLLVITLISTFFYISEGSAVNRIFGQDLPRIDKTSIPDEIVVKFKEGVREEIIAQLNARFGTSIFKTSRLAGFKRLRVPKGRTVQEMVDRFKQDAHVEYAEPNFIAQAQWVPNDQYYPIQWHLDNPVYGGINAEQAWDITKGDSSVIIAVIDTGVAYENYTQRISYYRTVQYYKAPDLANTVFVPGYDFVSEDTHPNDDNGHGTHVTGTIAQSTNNGTGVAGIAFNCSIMPVKVLDRYGSGTYTDVADGIRWAADQGAKVINMSLGGSYPSTTLESAVAYAYNKGVTIVCAAGNNGQSTLLYPAAYDAYCISVGAIRYDETRTDYSNYGTGLDLVAPGGDVSVDQNGDGYPDGVLQQTFGSTYNDWGYYFYEGTSMATPHVSGVAALIISAGIATTPDEVRTILRSTAKNLGPPGWDPEYGWGRVDAFAALNQISETTPPSPSPMTWATSPYAASATSIAMVATTATDSGSPPVSYYFDFIDSTTGGTGGTDSGWQTSTSYTDSGLQPNHQYGYQVKAKDNLGNETTPSNPTKYAYTAIETPTGIIFGTVTSTGIWVQSTNTPSGLIRGSSGLIIENTTKPADSGWKQNNDLWESGGLSANVQYSFRAKAKNGDAVETGYCSPVSKYTLANVPGSASPSDQGQTCVRANWLANGNSAMTQYYVENTTKGTNSGWMTSTYWDSCGLVCGSTYSFRVKAKNGEGMETVWTDLPNAQTAACETTPPSPSPMTWATSPYAASATSIAMVATTATDSGSPPVSYYFDFIDSTTGGTGGTDSGWQTSTSYTDSGLQPNHQYGYQVKARDSASNPNETSPSLPVVYKYTLANVPGSGSFSDVTQTGIRVNWTANGNRSGTEFWCENTTQGTSSGWTTATSWDSGGLTYNTSYSFRVKARNGDGVETGYSPTVSKYTLANVPGSASPSDQGQTCVRANWLANGNSAMTQYYVENTTKGTNSGWIASTYWDSCGLVCGNTYSFRVKAKNGEGVETVWTDLPNAQTAACENPQTEEFTFTGTVARRSEVRHPVNVKPGALSMYAKLTWGVVDDLRLRIYDPNGAMVAEVDKSTYGNNVEEITLTNPMAGEWKIAVYSESYWRSVSYGIQVVVSY